MKIVADSVASVVWRNNLGGELFANRVSVCRVEVVLERPFRRLQQLHWCAGTGRPCTKANLPLLRNKSSTQRPSDAAMPSFANLKHHVPLTLPNLRIQKVYRNTGASEPSGSSLKHFRSCMPSCGSAAIRLLHQQPPGRSPRLSPGAPPVHCYDARSCDGQSVRRCLQQGLVRASGQVLEGCDPLVARPPVATRRQLQVDL